MADPAKALRSTDRVVDKMALANAEPIPGIHLNGKNFDQGFDQPGPQRHSRGAPNPAPAAQCGDRLVNADARLTHHDPSQGALTRFPVGLMGLCSQLTANPGDVLRVDEVEAGVGP